jgi:ribosomal-protein-alanine N-acetyltransferase
MLKRASTLTLDSADFDWLRAVELAPMTGEDLDEVLSLERQAFPSAWSRGSYERELRNTNSYYYTARREGALAGYVGLWVVLDEAHITTIAVHPDYRRRGLGSHMIQLAMDLARRHGAGVLTLEVREGNHPALEMYRKLSFQQTGFLPRYYGDTHENAVVMRKTVPPGRPAEGA